MLLLFTMQKRGYFSKIGVVCVSLNTGEILDYSVRPYVFHKTKRTTLSLLRRWRQWPHDGDSSYFGRVKDAKIMRYGDNYVVQKKCVGHV